MTGKLVTVLKFTVKNYLKNLVKILDTPAHEGKRSNSVNATEIIYYCLVAWDCRHYYSCREKRQPKNHQHLQASQGLILLKPKVTCQ